MRGVCQVFRLLSFVCLNVAMVGISSMTLKIFNTENTEKRNFVISVFSLCNVLNIIINVAAKAFSLKVNGFELVVHHTCIDG